MFNRPDQVRPQIGENGLQFHLIVSNDRINNVHHCVLQPGKMPQGNFEVLVVGDIVGEQGFNLQQLLVSVHYTVQGRFDHLSLH